MSNYSSGLADLPAIAPPQGVEPNFTDPGSTQKTPLIILNAIFLPPMLIMVLIRVHVRTWIQRALTWDDYFCIISALASIVSTVLLVTSISIGFDRHLWDLRAITLLTHPSYVRRYSAIFIVYPIAVFTIKTSILLFYLRIFTIHRGMRWAIFTGIGCLALFYGWYLAIASVTVALCISNTATSYICHHIYVINVSQSVINMITDFYILLLPVSMLLKLQLRNRKKLGLLAIFLSGFATCLVSLARCILVGVTLKGDDTTWKAALTSELTIAEINIGIITACMPTVPAFLKSNKAASSAIITSLSSRFIKKSQGQVTLPLKEDGTLLSRPTKSKSRKYMKHLEHVPLPPIIYRSPYMELEGLPNAGTGADRNDRRTNSTEVYPSSATS